MQQRLRSAIAAFALSTAPFVQAAVIVVPDDNPSLRDAVASAVPGDVVQVRPGTY